MSFYVGIDVSKSKHTCCIINDKGEVRKNSFEFSNTLDGYKTLISELDQLSDKDQIFTGLEATGHFMFPLVSYLNSVGYKVQVINPIKISHFRKWEEETLAKTDKLDALLIARYMFKNEFIETKKKNDVICELRKATRFRRSVIYDRTHLYNRLHRYLDEVFPEFVTFFSKKPSNPSCFYRSRVFENKSVLFLLKNYPTPKKMSLMHLETANKLRSLSKGRFSLAKFQELKELSKNSIGSSTEMDEHIIVNIVESIEKINSTLDSVGERIKTILSECNSPILSIPGIGDYYAAEILAEVGDFNRFSNPDKLVKFAGLDVKVYQSGNTEKHGNLSKKAPRELRYALFLSAMKVRIHTLMFSKFYLSKKEQGKKEIVALNSVARKLLKVIWKMSVTNTLFKDLEE